MSKVEETVREWLEVFGEADRYAIRTASLSLSVRALAHELPERLRITLQPSGGGETRLPLAVRQLLKLALVSSQIGVELRSAVEGEALRVWLSTEAGGDVELERARLGEPLIAQLFPLVASLLAPQGLGMLLGRLAFSTAAHETQRIITSYMLRTDDLDEALYIMLSGVTSGDALGFNRAVFFRYDDSAGVFRGALGIGPYDAEEASRVWEELEVDDRGFEALLQASLEHRPQSRFNTQIQGLVVEPVEGDEVSRLLQDASGQVATAQESPRNAALAALSPRGTWLLCEVRAHGKRLGLVFADNRYSLTPVRADQIEHFRIFTQQSALVWENLSLRKSVEHQARYDALTGALNRRAVREYVEALDAERAACALLVIDLDHFKSVNDTHGHSEGDRWLQCISSVLGDEGVVGRYGGDEFVLLLPGQEIEGLRVSVGRIGARALEEGISVSMGGAAAPEDCGSVSELFSVADQRLYAAKRSGRCRACVKTGELIRFGTS